MLIYLIILLMLIIYDLTLNYNIFRNMSKVKILWIDDQIDLLKSHIIFLNERNYHIHTCTN